MSQSKAIMRHIARKHDLLGKTEQEKDRLVINLYGEIIYGIITEFTSFAHSFC